MDKNTKLAGLAGLAGLGALVALNYRVPSKDVDETLEDQINRALSEEREKIRPSVADINTFSWVTEDNNPIHRLPKLAQQFGFTDIPVMGAHIAAYGEQYIEGVVQHMRDFWGADIKIIGQKNKFRKPLYPEERVLWQVTDFKKNNSTIDLRVSGAVKDNEIVSITSRLGNEYLLMPQIAGPIYSKRYLFERAHLDAFYDCVGGKRSEIVPNMLPAAFVPATLLALLKDKTRTMEGINWSMDFDFIAQAIPGPLQVDIFSPRKPMEVKGSFVYQFETVVSQDNTPITYGKIVSATRHKINLD